MSLREVYQRFLDVPNPISLSENASLHYITTLTSFSQPGPIIRHLETQNKKVVKARNTEVISAVEGANALALEVETTLDFLSGGGAYLPGLEDFIVDKSATLPLTHMVHFDAEQKISQVRISWDQATLLKQTEVIGSRGRNWPVVDGQDQIRLIRAGGKSNLAGSMAPPTATATTTTRRDSERPEVPAARDVSPSKRYIKDPHASLDLFTPRPVDENSPLAAPNAVAPRSSAKPPPREMSELFAAGHEDNEPGSPKKAAAEPVIAPKAGGSQKFAASRLFVDDADEPATLAYKTNPAKYNHFDLGEEIEDDPLQYREAKPKAKAAVPMRPKTNKHGSQWDFQDFATPQKIPQKVRGQDVVHFTLDGESGDFKTPGPKQTGRPRRDNDVHFELQDDGTLVERAPVSKPRKDAEPHFQFRDSATPAAPGRTAPRPISAAGDRQGLYSNNLYREDGDAPTPEKAPLSTITNNAGRKQDFDSHWSMAHDSPKASNENQKTVDPGQTASHMPGTSRENYDQTPGHAKKVSASARLRKGMESHWDMGGPEDAIATDTAKPAAKSFWDF